MCSGPQLCQGAQAWVLEDFAFLRDVGNSDVVVGSELAKLVCFACRAMRTLVWHTAPDLCLFRFRHIGTDLSSAAQLQAFLHSIRSAAEDCAHSCME